MNRCILISAVLLFVVGDVPLWARAVRELQASDTIAIDARSGTIQSSRRRFPKQDQVLIAVKNINPFVHQYRIVGTTASYPEGAVIAQAIEALFGVTLPSAPDLVVGQTSRGGTEQMTDPCASSDTTIQQIMALRLAAQRRLDSIEAYRKTVTRRIDSSEAALRNSSVEEAHLHTSTKDYATFLVTVVASLASQLIALDDTAAAYAAAVGSFTTFGAPVGGTACHNLEVAAIKFVIDTVLVNRLAGRADSLLPVVRERLGEVDRVASNPTLLHLEQGIGGFDEPSIVSFVVQRSPAGTDTVWRTIAADRLTFGEPRRFGIAVGLAFSGKTRQFATIHRYRTAADNPASDSIHYVIAENSTSTITPSPTAALSVLLREHLTLQVGAGVRPSGDLTLNYFAGFSYAFMDGRVLLGAGLASVEQEKLLGGFAVGDSLPESQTTAPTKTVRSLKPYLGVLFRAF